MSARFSSFWLVSASLLGALLVGSLAGCETAPLCEDPSHFQLPDGRCVPPTGGSDGGMDGSTSPCGPCPADLPRCDESSRMCVACIADGDCLGSDLTPACVSGVCGCREGSCSDGSMCDPDLGQCVPDSDGGLQDAGTDAGGGCPIGVDSETLALYPFDSRRGTDVAGMGAPEAIFENVDATSPEDSICEGGLLFQGGATVSYAYLEDTPLWDGAVSVDFYLRPDGDATMFGAGVLSRDSSGPGDGHITIAYLNGNYLVARVQGPTDGNETFLCSDHPLVPGTWHHIGLNFGAGRSPQLFVDGDASVRPDGTSVRFLGTTELCGGVVSFDPAGSSNVWVLGANNGMSSEGEINSLGHFFFGALDQLRISSRERGFGGSP